jgi:hypothetical protein
MKNYPIKNSSFCPDEILGILLFVLFVFFLMFPFYCPLLFVFLCCVLSLFGRLAVDSAF